MSPTLSWQSEQRKTPCDAQDTLRYQAILLANVGDAIVASDADHRLTARNAAAERLYGWKAEGFTKQDVTEFKRGKAV